MMIKRTVTFLIIVVFFFSCNIIPESIPEQVNYISAGQLPGTGRTHHTNGVSINDFPHEVGSWWIYRHGYNSAVDTIRMRIIGKITLSSGTIKYLWLLTPENVVDTITISGDTVSCQDASGLLGNKKYIFPLYVGARWENPLGYQIFYDSSYVDRLTAITVENKIYNRTFHIYTRRAAQYIDWDDDRWFSPGIGIIMVGSHIVTLESNQFTNYWGLLAYGIGRSQL